MSTLHIILTLTALAGCLLSYSQTSSAQESAVHQPGYTTTKVESRMLQRERRFFVYPDHRVRYRVFAEQSGTVKNNRLQENTIYEKGERLLTLKNDTVHTDLLQRRSQLQQARQDLEKFTIGVRHGQNTQQELQKARGQVETAKSYYDISQDEYAALTVVTPFKGKALRVSAKLHAAQEQNVTAISKGEFLVELVEEAPFILKGVLGLPRGDYKVEDCKAKVEENGQLLNADIGSWRLIGETDDGNTLEIILIPPTQTLQRVESGSPVPAFLFLPSRFVTSSVPRAFVLYKGDMRYCLVSRNGELHETSVMTGEYDSEYIEIFGEIQPGDTVLRPEGQT